MLTKLLKIHNTITCRIYCIKNNININSITLLMNNFLEILINHFDRKP